MTMAITWWIANNAETCPAVSGTPLRVARAQTPRNGPMLRLWFTIDPDDVVSLWWLDLATGTSEVDEEE